MSGDPLRTAFSFPGAIQFPDNRDLAQRFDQAGGRVVRRATGQLVFYRPDGRRMLATDPAGHPLHECEWGQDAKGAVILRRARLRLDWGRWVGLKPGGLVNETRLNLATKPGWQRLKAEDLRQMAAQAMRVPIEEVRFFYGDEDLVIDAHGQATIRHRKDAFYVLEDGSFDKARFMSCMGAMHWDRIDFLPVVELFKSLLPGTGSAAFELIRGLYDDQNEGQPAPRPLRYRGIPTYPSEAAFGLFSSFFTAQAPGGGDPVAIFMDPSRAHQLTWLPSHTWPLRYFDEAQRFCMTVRGGQLVKVTCADDPAGMSYVSPKGRRVAAWDRSAMIVEGRLRLKDRDRTADLSLPQDVGRTLASASEGAPAVSPVDWRSVFVPGVPTVQPGEVFGAVLLYAQDETPIGELAAQPFVADYLQDLAEQDREIGQILLRAERILIENGDAVISTCIPFDRPREVVATVCHPAFAFKQAQHLWTVCAELQRWDWLQRTQFILSTGLSPAMPVGASHDLAYVWLPYEEFDRVSLLAARLRMLAQRIKAGGHAFLVGPARLGDELAKAGFHLYWEEAVERLPTFAMHRTILPKAKLRSGLTMFHVRRS
ncbi:hypothetical protein ACO9S2_02425 [Nitrospira sp. NS4]|uniref:hypothetical protein n=1 Tax=Nitrospira sp. NS4 TaxID=3414498 RepID=UPI003C2ADEFE